MPISAPSTKTKFESGMPSTASIAGWKGIQASDMLLMPDPNTAYIDPFFDETTLVLSCDVIDPPTARATTATRAPSPTAPRPT